MSKIRIASIDIGKKNFAFYIEEFDSKALLKLENIPPTERYNEDGTPTKEFQTLLQTIYSNGKTILCQNLDLTNNCDSKLSLDPETFHNMIEALDKYAEYWDYVHTFVIEEQMAFGKKLNKMAVKLGQHCYSYFTFKYLL
jgi:hypothetical protein